MYCDYLWPRANNDINNLCHLNFAKGKQMQLSKIHPSIYFLSLIMMITNIPTRAQPYSESVVDTTFTEALSMIQMPEPFFDNSHTLPEMDSTQIADLGFDQVYESSSYTFFVRDGKKLHAQRFEKDSQTTILILHGVASSSYMYNRMAGLLQAATHAEVFTIDWRGHGQSEGTPGDVDYVDQYADDLADVISSIRKSAPDKRVLLAGHSMGGGIALRYAIKNDVPEVDGYLLFAPLLGHDAPTMRKEPLVQDEPAEPFMKVHVPRLIGIYMMNSIGNHDYDSLPILFLNLPEGTRLTSYTYRANASTAPEDYIKGLNAVSKPLLVIVGSKDEAFLASAYEPAIETYSTGKAIVIDGATHNGVRHSEQAMQAVESWYLSLDLK